MRLTSPLMKFCGWGWDLPGTGGPRWELWNWAADLGGLFLLWHFLAPAAAELGDPRLIIVGGWAASMAAAMAVYCGAQVKCLAGVGRRIFGARTLAMVPFIVAVSLAPCAMWQWWMGVPIRRSCCRFWKRNGRSATRWPSWICSSEVSGADLAAAGFLGFGAKKAEKVGVGRLKRFALRYSRGVPHEKAPPLPHRPRHPFFPGSL